MRSLPTRSLPLVLLLWAAGASCGRTPPPAPDLVARIGPEEIRYGRFEEYVKRTAGDGETVLAGPVLSQLFDQFLDEELLSRLAIDRGLAREGASAALRRKAVDAMLASSMQNPAETEIAAWYQAHRDELARPERVRLRQILTEDRATAERALREISAGADFAQVARKLSRDPGAASGGLASRRPLSSSPRGWFVRGPRSRPRPAPADRPATACPALRSAPSTRPGRPRPSARS